MRVVCFLLVAVVICVGLYVWLVPASPQPQSQLGGESTPSPDSIEPLTDWLPNEVPITPSPEPSPEPSSGSGLGLGLGLSTVPDSGSEIEFENQPNAQSKATSDAQVVQNSPTSAAKTESRQVLFVLTIQDGQLVNPQASYQVLEGQTVVLEFTANHADELHLHGYDLSLDLSANQPAQMQFVASAIGRFEMESHHRHEVLFMLDVLPNNIADN